MLISIAGTTLKNWQYQGSVARLRAFADQDFITSDGEMVKQGWYNGQKFYRDTVLSIVGTNVTIPTITNFPTTTDSPSDPSATFSFYLYDYRGVRRAPWLVGVKIPHTVTSPMTWAAIEIYNHPPGPQPGVYGISYDQAVLLISQGVGELHLANVGVIGNTELDEAPLDSAHPIAVSVTSNRVAKACATGLLVDGVAIVPETRVTESSRIFLTAEDDGISGTLRVSDRTEGVSFTVTSNNGGDNGTFAYVFFEALL